MITRIHIHGLKSVDRELDLTGRDAMVGGARTGKSTVRQALIWFATGQNPDVGLALKDAGLLMRDAEMSVRVEWDDGSWAERVLRRHGQSLRQSGAASWLPPDTGTTEVLEAIRARFGADDRQARENLDIAGFLKQTGPAQAEAINALLDESGMTVDEIATRLGAMTAVRITQSGDVQLTTDPDDLAAVRAGAEAQMGQAHRERYVALVGEAQTRIAQDGLTSAIAWAKGQKRDAQAAMQSKVAARKEVEDRDASLEAPAATLEQLNAERQQLTDEIAGLRSELTRYAQGTKARAEARDALDEALTALDAVVEGKGDPEEVAARHRTRAHELDEHASSLIEPNPPVAPGSAHADQDAITQAEHLEAKASELHAQAREVLVATAKTPVEDPLPELPSTDGAKANLMMAEQRLKAAAGDPWTEVREIAEGLIEEPEARGRLLELADEHAPDVDALRSSLEGARKRLQDAEAARAEAAERREMIADVNARRRAEHEATYAQAREIRAEADALSEQAATIRGRETNRVAEANAERDRAYRKARSEWRVQADTIARQRATAKAEAKRLREEADELLRAYEAARHTVERAEARVAGMAEIEPIDVDEHELRIAEANQAIARLDETKRMAEGAVARRDELTALGKEIDRATATRDVAAALAWALPKLRDEDLAARRGPILDRMGAFLGAAGLADRPYLEAKKGAVDYGLIVGPDHPDLEAGHRVNGLVLSGAESVLFRTALWAAIVGLRAPHTPILALEIDDLDDGMAERFFAGLGALRIPNILICTNRALPIPEAFTRHEMAHAEVAA